MNTSKNNMRSILHMTLLTRKHYVGEVAGANQVSLCPLLLPGNACQAH